MSRGKKPADAWAEQAVAHFGDGPITAGVDYLKDDPSRLNDPVPKHLEPCWATEGEDLSHLGYFKADPQPNHSWTKRKMVLWLTHKDYLEQRRKAERELVDRRLATTDDKVDRIEEEGGVVLRRKGQHDSIGPDG